MKQFQSVHSYCSDLFRKLPAEPARENLRKHKRENKWEALAADGNAMARRARLVRC